MSLPPIAGMPLGSLQDRSDLGAPSPASNSAWLREMERANAEHRAANGPQLHAAQGGGSEGEGAAGGRAKPNVAPELPLDTPKRQTTNAPNEEVSRDGVGRPAASAGGSAGEVGQDVRSSAVLAPLPTRQPAANQGNASPWLQAAHVQWLARKAWAATQVVVASGEAGISVSIRDRDLEEIDKATLVRQLESESARAGHALSSLTVNGKQLKE